MKVEPKNQPFIHSQLCPFLNLPSPLLGLRTKTPLDIEVSSKLILIIDQLLTSTSPTIAPVSEFDQDLLTLERAYNSSEWLATQDHEPVVGDFTCPTSAEKYGIRGKSCYTVFVEDKDNGTYGCRYERCRAFFTRSLDDAVRHQRNYHFDHRPFLCTPPSGQSWYVLTTLGYLFSLCTRYTHGSFAAINVSIVRLTWRNISNTVGKRTSLKNCIWACRSYLHLLILFPL